MLRGLNDDELRVVKKQDVRDTVDCIRWTMEDTKDPSTMFIIIILFICFFLHKNHDFRNILYVREYLVGFYSKNVSLFGPRATNSGPAIA